MRLSFSTVLYLRLGAEQFERWVFAATWSMASPWATHGQMDMVLYCMAHVDMDTARRTKLIVLYCTVLVWMLAMMLLPAAEGLDLDLYANQQSAAGARAGG
jgi:hypothetical protein